LTNLFKNDVFNLSQTWSWDNGNIRIEAPSFEYDLDEVSFSLSRQN